MIRAVVFDFDGTLVDSNAIKRDAWFSIFLPEEGVSPARIREVRDRVKETRYDILRALFLELGRPADDIGALVNKYAARYHKIVQETILKRGLIFGAREMLNRLCGTYPLFLVSATPEDAVQDTVEKLGIRHFFQGVYGKPASKEANVRAITTRAAVTCAEIVLIGDGLDDIDAAQALGSPFIGIRSRWNGWTGAESFCTVDGIKGVHAAFTHTSLCESK